MSKINITVHVANRKGAEGAKVRVLSDVVIRLDGKKAVAFATLGGKYSPLDALKEFRKNPARFAPQGQATAADLAVYAKVA